MDTKYIPIHDPVMIRASSMTLPSLNLWEFDVKGLVGLSILLNVNKTGLIPRTGNHPMLMSGRDWCPGANRFDKELRTLGIDSRNALNSHKAHWIDIVAAFFIRFLTIHPLRDGNGRLSRIILALQAHELRKIDPSETLKLIKDFERDYRMVWVADEPSMRFTLMVSLLHTIWGEIPGDVTVKPPFPVAWSGHSQVKRLVIAPG